MKYDVSGAENSLEIAEEVFSVIVVAWKVNEVYLILFTSCCWIAKRLKKELECRSSVGVGWRTHIF